MPSHDAFRELAALAAVGEISVAENDQLMAHLKECPECREAYAEYSAILRQDLPHANSLRLKTPHGQSTRATNVEIRERFLARARAHGVEFSADVANQSATGREFAFRVAWSPVAAVAAGIVVTAGLSATFLHRNHLRASAPAVAVHAPVASREPSLPKAESDKRMPAVQDVRLAQLERENRELTTAVQGRQAQLDEMQQSLTQLNAELAQTHAENSTLTAAREQDRSEIADLQKQVQTLQSTSADSVATLVELQDRIRALNTSLQQQSEKANMERQMAAVSSDVRQLMGARVLHIIDVHDVNGEGRSARSFGRVFYAEGQCLVFYAFDLPSSKPTPTKLYFKAWGQQEAEDRSVRNLGTFTIDDRDQQRWVLKVTDAALLKGIDSVFVTAETAGDARQPEGKRVLYAYLAGRANHP